MKTYNVLTIFPEMIDVVFKQGVISKAIDKGIVSINSVNIRDYAEGRHLVTDDYQYGGGAGLVMKVEPIYEAVSALKEKSDTFVVLLDPRGKKFDQKAAEHMASNYDNITFICGRYEGVDERVRELVVDMELSLGDFILTGGEFAAITVIDSIARLVPGVLGDEASADEESFTTGMLEYPHYTRPVEYKGLSVPEVLMNGNHSEIEKWRMEKAIEITRKNRPDLLNIKELDIETRKKICAEQKRGLSKKLKLNVALMHYPMKDKQGDTVATAITNLDLHDISRSCRTYSVENYYVVTPIVAQREIASRVINHWMGGFGSTYNPNRMEAFSHTMLMDSLSEAVLDIEKRHKKRPLIVATTARPDRATITAKHLGVISEEQPVLIIFGTGWGFADEVLETADYILEPIEGVGEFNHLSVRSAVAILLDRITEI